jgi:C1A family cysteine protease
MEKFVPPGLGWLRSGPDFRDFTPRHPAVCELMRTLKSPEPAAAERPSSVDLRECFWQVEDQGALNCSTAYACLGLVEYFESTSGLEPCQTSKLFLYKATRKLMRAQGDAGADLRSSLKALVRFGVPSLAYWPRRDDKFDDEPSDPFLYGFADRYRSIRYVRLDVPNATGSETLDAVKSWLAAGFPCVFGVPICTSLMRDPDIQYRPTFDTILGGQAFIAVGYDDNRRSAQKGALLVRISWGRAWGDDGYGWLPYPYIKHQLAVDFWTLLKQEWLELGGYRRPCFERVGELVAESAAVRTHCPVP